MVLGEGGGREVEGSGKNGGGGEKKNLKSKIISTGQRVYHDFFKRKIIILTFLNF